MAKKKAKKNGAVKVSPNKYIVSKARQLPLGKTYICRTAAESGTCVAVVTREHAGGKITAGIYLIDTFCLGVKDTYYYFSIDPEEFRERFLEGRFDFEETDYTEVHNLIYGALEYAEEAGIPPHDGFRVTEYILEPDDDRIPLIEFEFGHDGVRELVIGPDRKETKYIPLLEKNVPGEFIVSGYTDSYQDYDSDDDDFYEATTGSDDPRSFNFDFHPFPHEPYPEELEEVRHEELLDIFYPEKRTLGNTLDALQIATLRAIPREELLNDLRVIVGYELGQAEQEIVEDECYNLIESNVMYHIWAILAETGGPDTADIALKFLQQSYHWHEAYMGDFGLEISHSVLANVYGDNPEELVRMTAGQGFSVHSRATMLFTLECIALWNHAVRGRIEKSLHDLADLILHGNGSELPLLNDYFMGTLASVMAGLHMRSDLPLIKEMYDRELINPRIFESYERLVKDLDEDHIPESRYTRLEDIYQKYK